MLAGGEITSLVITKLAPAGARIKQGDLLVEFDRQKQLKNSLDKQAEYREFEDQIEKKKGDQASARAKDETELKQAEGALETARLEMRKNEVVSRIDAEKNKENLAEAEARLKQLRGTVDLKRRAAEAEIRDLEIQRDRARNAMRYAQQNAEKMAIRAPIDGLVVLNRIWKGGRMDEPQEGDQIEPGMPFLQVVDPRAMQVRANVNQVDVPYLEVGQRVRVRLDAYPELVFPGKLLQMAAIGVTSGLSDKVHTFATLFSIEGTDPKLLPDLSAAVDVELERIPNVLVAPRDAVLEKGGQPYVRVKAGSGFDERPVKTGPKDEVDVVIESGVDAGVVVLRGVR
jgi:multidrug resistance efflux pump